MKVEDTDTTELKVGDGVRTITELPNIYSDPIKLEPNGIFNDYWLECIRKKIPKEVWEQADDECWACGSASYGARLAGAVQILVDVYESYQEEMALM